MKKRDSLLLILSISCVSSLVGYSSWATGYKYSYSQSNKIQSIPVAYIVGKEDIKYTSIEKALDVAKSGDIVCVIAPQLDNYHPTDNKIKPDKVTYEISRNCTIKEGVTLILPTDKKTISSVTNQNTLVTYIKSMREDDRTHGETTKNSYDYKESYSKYADDYKENYLRVTVKIKDGVSLINNGTLVISGYLSAGSSASAGIRGQTSHSYSQIILGKGSSIVQKGNKSEFHCYGYVKEEINANGSFVEFSNGNIYMPLIVKDYKGFQFLSGIQDAVKKQGCSPFNILEMRNFECKVSFKYGSSLFGVTNIYYYQSAGSLGTYEDTLHNVFKLIGNQNDALINLNDGIYSSIEACYDNLNTKIKINFIGGVKFGNLAFKITANSFGSIDLNTKYGFFPISHEMDIDFNKAEGQTSALFDSSEQKIKLLPGSKLTINEGCTLTGSELVSLSAFVDGPQGERSDAKWSAGAYYPLKEGATCIIKNNSFLSMNNVGGIIYCDNENNITYKNNLVSIKEGWNQKQKGLQYVTKDYLELSEKCTIMPLSNSEKRKIYVGMNHFIDPESSSSFVPHITITSKNEEKDFNGIQGIVFLDSIENAKVNLISNINNVKKSVQKLDGSYPGLEDYRLEEISAAKNVILCGIDSSVSVSSNNNGINEFEVQQITIKSLTAKVDGKDPLYVNGNIYLTAEISNANQAYDKTVTWSSSNENIATIDQDGKITGKSLGKVTFSATCGGKTAYYETEVIEDSSKIGISDAWIVDEKNNSSKTTKDYTKDIDRPSGYGVDKYGTWKYSAIYKDNNGQTKFSLKYAPENAVISKIVWSFSGTTKNYLLNYDGTKNTSNSLDDDGSLSATVKRDGYTNAKPDGAVLKCTIEDITGNLTIIEFFIVHDSGVNIPCIIEKTKIMLSGGIEREVENLENYDELLVFDHEVGKITSSKLFFNYHQNEDNIVTAPILKLSFENGNYIEIHVDHGFFNYTRKEYVYINKDNYMKFINDEFIFLEKPGKLGKTRLLKGNVKVKTVRVYSPVSVYHLNVFTNGFLSITGEIEGWFNYFDCNDSLKFNEEKKKKDIERYGLYEYEDFKDYIRKEIFDLLPIPYLKVSVGKGLTTKENIIKVMKKYLSFM